MAYILQKLLTLIGGRPVTQKSTKVLGDLRKKPYVVGIFFCLFHFCFIIISDYVTELISVTDPEVFKEENNIRLFSRMWGQCEFNFKKTSIG